MLKVIWIKLPVLLYVEENFWKKKGLKPNIVHCRHRAILTYETLLWVEVYGGKITHLYSTQDLALQGTVIVLSRNNW